MKRIIFDLDGTLIDTEPAWREGDYLLAQKYHFALDDDFRKQVVGRGLKEVASLYKKHFKLHISEDVLNIERLNFVYQSLFRHLKLMPYADELLTTLKKKGYTIAIATAGHQPTNIWRIVDTVRITPYVSAVVGGCEVKHSKPAPDIYLEAAKRLGTPPEECVVVEDAVSGIIAGKSAKMKVIAVNSNADLKPDFLAVGADICYPDLRIPLEAFE